MLLLLCAVIFQKIFNDRKDENEKIPNFFGRKRMWDTDMWDGLLDRRRYLCTCTLATEGTTLIVPGTFIHYMYVFFISVLWCFYFIGNFREV